MNISSKMIKLYLNKVNIRLFIAFSLNLILFLSPYLSQSQISELGLPFIQNYTVKDYGTESQNFSITQDNNRNMYFGNLSGVLKYNEMDWRLINIHGWPYVSVSDSGVVFVASFNEFGYLNTNKNGIDEYISLKEKFINKSDFGVVNNVIAFKEHVFIEAEKRLYHYYKDYVFLVDTAKPSSAVFRVGNELYINHSTKGLTHLVNSEMVEIPGGGYFRQKEIIDILQYNNKLLIRLANYPRFLLYDFYNIVEIETDADNFLNSYNYTKGVKLSDGSYAFATKKNGIVFLNSELKIILHINKMKGMNDNSVYCLFIDKSDNLWAGLRNGISRIEYPSPFTYFSSTCGIEGGVLSVIRHNNQLFVGTLSGLFSFTRGINDNKTSDCINERAFTRVPEITGIVYDLLSIQNNLYVITEYGLYLVKDKQAINIYPILLRSAMVSPNDSNIIYVGGDFGFSALKIGEKGVTDLGRNINIEKRVRTIAYDNSGDVWCGTNNYGVFRLPDMELYSPEASVIHYTLDSLPFKTITWVDVYTTMNGLLISSEAGLYKFNYSTNSFYEDTIIGLELSTSNKWAYPIVEDNNGNLILSIGSEDNFEKESIICSFDKNTGKYSQIKDPFRKIIDFTVEEFYPDENGILWIGGTEGLIRYDNNVIPTHNLDFSVIINSISLRNDSVIYINNDNDYAKRNNKITIDYGYNTLKFSFVCPAFIGEDIVEYKIFMENLDKNWSDWSLQRTKEYNSLSPGKYIFNVKAKVNNKETEVARLNFTIKAPFYSTILAYFIYAIIALSFGVAYFTFRGYLFAKEKNKLEKIIKERTDELLKEIERAQDLLVNMLPKQTADELKMNGKASTKKFKMVTVLFSDIQGFTGITEVIEPDNLVRKLDEFFFNVDKIIEKHKIEKIKTIGDGYMCAGGIPEKDRTNPITVLLAALEIIAYMKTFEFDVEKTKNLTWGIRIGVNTGPVIAGVIGTKKYSYDIWGVTVNTASRLEAFGTPGKINISETTYNHVKDFFICEKNKPLKLKSGADINMFFVNSIKPQYSINGEGQFANNELTFRLAEIRYEDLYDFIINKLETELPANLYYHDAKHTIDVTFQVEIIGKSEGVSREELLLLKTASLFHDLGFTINYDNHELHGFKLAKEILPRYQYSKDQIDLIGQLIMATKFPPNPKNNLEMIICDADLDYLGRKDFVPVSRNLFMELYERKRIKSVNEWLKTQIKFIEKHTYYTQTALNKRDVNKNQQLENIKKMDFLSSFF